MRCALFTRCGGNRTGADVYDKDDIAEQQYERAGTPVTSYVLLAVLVAVVGFIAVLAAWTGA
jgi:hypothetical protein